MLNQRLSAIGYGHAPATDAELAAAWRACVHARPLVEIVERTADRRALVAGVCACIRLTLEVRPDAGSRSALTALETIERWVGGRASDAALDAALASLEGQDDSFASAVSCAIEIPKIPERAHSAVVAAREVPSDPDEWGPLEERFCDALRAHLTCPTFAELGGPV